MAQTSRHLQLTWKKRDMTRCGVTDALVQLSPSLCADHKPHTHARINTLQLVSKTTIVTLKGEVFKTPKTSVIKIVHLDTCDLSGPSLHGEKLAPERSEGNNSRRVMGHPSHKYRILFCNTFT